MLARERALQVYLSQVGVHEQGANNSGPQVEMYQRADSLPGEHYAWCMSLAQFCWRMATGGKQYLGKIVGGSVLAGGTASVGQFVEWAKQHGFVVSKPQRADHICFFFDGDSWADHVGMIEKVISLGPVCALITVEGNTGPSGAVSDPGTGADGVYRKKRVVRRSSFVAIRVPGAAASASPVVVSRPTSGPAQPPSGVVYEHPEQPPRPKKPTSSKPIAKKTTSAAPKKKTSGKKKTAAKKPPRPDDRKGRRGA